MAKPSTSLTIIPVLPKGPAVIFGSAGAAPLSPISAGSSGGWQVVDRPHQIAGTQFYDSSPLEYELELLLDGGDHQDSVEPQCARVVSWLYVPAGGNQPPVLALRGPVSPQALGLYWVLNTFKMDDNEAIRNDKTGERTQQPVSLTLWQYVPLTASVLTSLSPAQAAQIALNASGSSAARKTYVVRAGDTLSTIAARVLGNQALWKSIATLNGIRDPSSLKAGTRLVLPST